MGVITWFQSLFRRKEKCPANIDEIKLIDNNGRNILKFEQTTRPLNFHENFIKIPQAALAENLTSQLLGAGFQAGAIKSAVGAGVFRATVAPSELMQYADGTFSSIVKEAGSGKFSSHHGFQEVSSAQIFAPIIIFQLASICTGQYYLNGITTQLSTLQEKVDEIIKLHHLDQESRIKAIFASLQELAKQERISSENILQLQTYKDDVRTIYIKYSQLFEDCKLEELTKAFNDNYLTTSRVEELVRKFNAGRLEQSAEMIFSCDILLRMIALLEIKLYAQHDNSGIKKLNELITKAREYQAPDSLKIAKKLESYYEHTFDILSSVENDAWWNKKSILSFRQTLKQKERECKERFQHHESRSSFYNQCISKLHDEYECIYDASTSDLYVERKNLPA